MSQNTPINAAIETLRESQKEVNDRVAFLRSYRTEINRLLAPLMQAYKDGLATWEPCLSAERNYAAGGHGHAACLSITARNLDGFKDPRLVKLLERFVHANEMSTSDWAESLNRDFNFEFRLPDNNAVRVCIVAYVRSDSETCRKVLKSVETKVVEEKVYEIVCD